MKIFLLLGLLGLTSCATHVRTVGSRMISPETQGKLGRGLVEGRLQAVQKNEMDFSGPNTKKKVTPDTEAYAPVTNVEMGFFRRLDAYIMPTFAGAAIGGVKFQFLGDPKIDAKKGNFSASLIAGYGGHGASHDSGNNDLVGLDDDDIDKISARFEHNDIGLIVGYRWIDQLVHYVNGYYLQERFSGRITNESGTLDDASFRYKNEGVLVSTGAIFYLKKIFFKADFSHLVTNWSYTRPITTNSLNAGFGFNW